MLPEHNHNQPQQNTKPQPSKSAIHSLINIFVGFAILLGVIVMVGWIGDLIGIVYQDINNYMNQVFLPAFWQFCTFVGTNPTAIGFVALLGLLITSFSYLDSGKKKD